MREFFWLTDGRIGQISLILFVILACSAKAQDSLIYCTYAGEDRVSVGETVEFDFENETIITHQIYSELIGAHDGPHQTYEIFNYDGQTIIGVYMSEEIPQVWTLVFDFQSGQIGQTVVAAGSSGRPVVSSSRGQCRLED